MSKLKYISKRDQVSIRCKLESKESINNQEIAMLSQGFVKGFMLVQAEGAKKLVFTGAQGVPLTNVLKRGISKDLYFLIVAQVMELIKSSSMCGLNLRNIVLDPEFIVINERNCELFFGYRAINDSQSSNNGIVNCLREISTLAKFDPQPDFGYANDFMNYVVNMPSFSITDAEEYIKRVSPYTYNSLDGMGRMQNIGNIPQGMMQNQNPQQGMPQNPPQGMQPPTQPAQGMPQNQPAQNQPMQNQNAPQAGRPAPSTPPTPPVQNQNAPQAGRPTPPTPPTPPVQNQNAPQAGRPTPPTPPTPPVQNQNAPQAGRPTPPTPPTSPVQNQNPPQAGRPTPPTPPTPPVQNQNAPQSGRPTPPTPPVQNQNAQQSAKPAPVTPHKVSVRPAGAPTPPPAAEENITAKLVRRSTNEEFTISKPLVKIGKDKTKVDIFITNNKTVSRVHANIIFKDGEFFVSDNNSTNRTFVNGSPIPVQTEIKIKNGDIVKFSNEEFDFIAE